MMNLCIVTSVEKLERLRYLVKGSHMLQGRCNVPCATRDEASVDVADGISKNNSFWRNKCAGEISHGIFDGRPSLSLRMDLPTKVLCKTTIISFLKKILISQPTGK